MLDIFTATSPLVLLGCGNMGRALAEGWLQAGLGTDALIVVDPNVATDALPGVSADRYFATPADIPAGMVARTLVVATKPQVIGAALPPLKAHVGSDTLVVSVAAGTPVSRFCAELPTAGAVVRTMPNTPAAVGAGISGLYADEGTAPEDRALATALLSAVGQTVWVAAEADLNSVTALSGSGPAYVFYMVECMASAGEALGLPGDVAMQLARQTVIGAAHLLEARDEVEAATLRARVTSPGGTTAAALDVLTDAGGLAPLMAKAIFAARRRGEELGS